MGAEGAAGDAGAAFGRVKSSVMGFLGVVVEWLSHISIWINGLTYVLLTTNGRTEVAVKINRGQESVVIRESSE